MANYSEAYWKDRLFGNRGRHELIVSLPQILCAFGQQLEGGITSDRYLPLQQSLGKRLMLASQLQTFEVGHESFYCIWRQIQRRHTADCHFVRGRP